MPRKLKAYQTSMGFFDLAVAAPSMKAALEAWGSKNNLFHQGFAHEVDDIEVVSATMAKPGVVLKRPVGSSKRFSENPDLPSSLPSRPMAKKAGSPRIKQRRGFDDKATKAAAKEYEREERKRDRERAKEKARREVREKAVAKVEAARTKAKEAHDGRLEKLQDELTHIEERISSEKRDWQTQIDKFNKAVSRARR